MSVMTKETRRRFGDDFDVLPGELSLGGAPCHRLQPTVEFSEPRCGAYLMNGLPTPDHGEIAIDLIWHDRHLAHSAAATDDI